MWLPGDLSVLVTGHKFVIDLCCGVIRGRFGLSELVYSGEVHQLVELNVYHEFCPLSRGFIVNESSSANFLKVDNVSSFGSLLVKN